MQGDEAGPGPGSLAQQHSSSLYGPGASPSRAGAAAGSNRGGSSSTAQAGDFIQMACRYLHPFNMDVNLARKNIVTLFAAARMQTEAAACGGSVPAGSRRDNTVTAYASVPGDMAAPGGSQPPSRGLTPRLALELPLAPALMPARHGAQGVRPQQPQPSNGGGDDDMMRAEVVEELLQEVLVTPEVVLTLQVRTYTYQRLPCQPATMCDGQGHLHGLKPCTTSLSLSLPPPFLNTPVPCPAWSAAAPPHRPSWRLACT